MSRSQTQVHRQSKASRALPKCRMALSLHSHTHHSKESLGFLPHYLAFQRIPVVSGLVESELKRYEERNGQPVDFHRAYWTPPVSPATVVDSETSQIQDKLDLAALVSITDHDTIAGPLSLLPQQPDTPISVEWSVPFAGNCFHIGVHRLPPDDAVAIMNELARYTAEPNEDLLGDLFTLLDRSPETLLILNHPCCNFVRVGPAQHWSSLRQFLARCGTWMHALEVNGMRPWNENQDVLRLAEEYDLPVVSGGDRHGSHPNTMLNLTQAGSWAEFVDDIRHRRPNDVLVLSAYEEPVRLRELATAADVLRHYPHYPEGQRRFTDRVFVDVPEYSYRPLSFHWSGGKHMPRWLQVVVAIVGAIGSDSARPILRRLLSMRGEYDRASWPLQANYGSEALNMYQETGVQ